MSSEEIVFYNQGGRPKKYTDEEARERMLASKRKWYAANQERIKLYNETIRPKISKKSLKEPSEGGASKRRSSRRGSRKARRHSKVSSESESPVTRPRNKRRNSRKRSRRHSRRRSSSKHRSSKRSHRY